MIIVEWSCVCLCDDHQDDDDDCNNEENVVHDVKKNNKTHNIFIISPKKMLLEYHTLARPGQNLLICLPNVYELARFVAFFCECLNATFWGHSVYYYRDIVSYIEYKHCSPSNI